MDRGDGEGPSGDEEEERPESQRKPNVRPELAQLEDEEELNLEEPDPDRPVQRPDDYEDDEDVYQGMSSASTYIVPILLAGPFYIFNVWRACHWVVHRVISFPLDFIVTPLENSRSVRKSVNIIGAIAKRIVRWGGIPLTLYIGWLMAPGVLKPNFLNIFLPFAPPYTDIQYEGWIKEFYAQQARIPMGPGGNIMRTGSRAG